MPSATITAIARPGTPPSNTVSRCVVVQALARNAIATMTILLIVQSVRRRIGSGARDFRQLRVAVLPRGLHEPREQRMPVARRRRELRMELRRDEPRVARQF